MTAPIAIKPNQKLLFDMITITLPININKREGVRDRLNDPGFYGQYNKKVYPKVAGQRYNNNYEFSIYNGTIVKLAIYPINKNHNFLRVEYNPTKLTKRGRRELRVFLIKLLGIKIMKTIYFQAVLTRLDLTLDVYDMEPNLYMHKNRVIQSSNFRGDGGKLSSQIIGSDSSNCRITMYDKNLEQQGKGKDHNGANYRRIEVRRRKLDCTMNELNDSLLEDIKQLNFYNSKFFGDTGFSKRFLDDTLNYGLNTALSKLDDNTRRRYKRYLEDYRAFPFSLDALDFDRAHKTALSSLIHLGYRKEYLDSVAS